MCGGQSWHELISQSSNRGCIQLADVRSMLNDSSLYEPGYENLLQNWWNVCVEITEALEGFVRGLIDVEPETKFDPQENIYLAYRQIVRLKCSFTYQTEFHLLDMSWSRTTELCRVRHKAAGANTGSSMRHGN